MAPDLGHTLVAIEIFKQREGQQKLLLGLEDQVFAVGIEHLAVTFQHIHHLDQVLGRVAQQGVAGQQGGLQLGGAGHAAAAHQFSGNDRHQPRPPEYTAAARAGSWTMAVLAASLRRPRP